MTRSGEAGNGLVAVFGSIRYDKIMHSLSSTALHSTVSSTNIIMNKNNIL